MSEVEMMNTFRAAIQKGVKTPSQDIPNRAANYQGTQNSRGVHGGFDAMRSAGIQRRF